MNVSTPVFVRDLAIWVGALAVAGLGAAASMQWDSRAHRVANIGALVAIVVAGLKNFPDLPNA